MLIKNYKGIQIFDDYGHHPIEIKATLSASREITKDKVVAIVQPHRYTRLKLLFEDFTSALALDPNYRDAYFSRGVAYKNIGNYTKAIEDFNSTLEIGILASDV